MFASLDEVTAELAKLTNEQLLGLAIMNITEYLSGNITEEQHRFVVRVIEQEALRRAGELLLADFEKSQAVVH